MVDLVGSIPITTLKINYLTKTTIMKAFISFPNNSVDSFLDKIEVSISRVKRSTFPKPFNIEVGDVFTKNKLKAKVIEVNRKTKEVVVVPCGTIRMTEKMFRSTFFDWSCCSCRELVNINNKIVVTERIITDFFTMERIIAVEPK